MVSICSLLDSLHNNRLLLRKKEGGRRRRGEETSANCFRIKATNGGRRDPERWAGSICSGKNKSFCWVYLTVRSVFPLCIGSMRKSCGACPAVWTSQHAGLTSGRWHRLCSRGRPWSTCLSGTAGSTGSAGSSSASGARRRTSSRSGPSGRTGTFYICTGVTRTWAASLKGYWSPSRRTGESCPRVRW